jgi:hypothetical protein
MSKETITFRTAEHARQVSRDFFKRKRIEELTEVMEKIDQSCSNGLYITIIDKELHPEIEQLLHQYGYRVNSIPITVADKQWSLSTHISWEK